MKHTKEQKSSRPSQNRHTVQTLPIESFPSIKNKQMTQHGTVGLNQDDQENHSSAEVFTPIETSTTSSIKHDVSAKTGIDLRELPIYAANRANDKLAMAVEGKLVILSHQSLANRPALIGHELVHIVMAK